VTKPSVPGFDGEAVHPDVEYVVAANIGHRGWYIMGWDRPLRSLTISYYWENRGVHSAVDGNKAYPVHDSWAVRGAGPVPVDRSPSIPRLENNHGFYAYYTTQHSWTGCEWAAIQVYGLIEGFGRTVAGSQGFRSEKAIISAFSLERTLARSNADFAPDDKDELRHMVREYLENLYPTVPIFNTNAEMLAVIPLSEKPRFTR
jgi:hypothetical protein